jgi:hypothetical protein
MGGFTVFLYLNWPRNGADGRKFQGTLFFLPVLGRVAGEPVIYTGGFLFYFILFYVIFELVSKLTCWNECTA